MVRRKNAELADLAETAAAEAERLLANAKPALRAARKKAADLAAAGGKDAAAGRRRGRLARAVNDLTELLEATRRIAAQTRQRITGVTPDGATRRVSLHDPDARPIAKGRLGKTGRVRSQGPGLRQRRRDRAGPRRPARQPSRRAPAEAGGRALKKRTGRTPQTVAADRGYGEQAVDDAMHDLGVQEVVIPRSGRPGKARQAHERQRTFRRHLKWRTGCEGRISNLKRGYGWDRTMIDTTEGARIWTGHGVLADNLVKISALAN